MAAESAEVEAYVGIGANLGDRAAAIRRAAELLGAAPGVARVRLSPIYESAPVGYLDQPPFLNAVAAAATRLGPLQLVLALQLIERAIGRTRTFRWGPREIDLDLLLYDGRAIQRRGLTVPHPAMHERAFVLVPLRDLWPDYRDPTRGSIDEMLAPLEPGQVIRPYGQ